MAYRTQPISRFPLWAGVASIILLLVLTIGTLGAAVSQANWAGISLGPADGAAIRFSVFQAVVSALVSILLAIPTARALMRRRFPGRNLMVSLLGAPFFLPGIVAVLGLVSVWGRAGYVSQMFGFFGWSPLNIYGAHGVILAHVFFNVPLATRLLLQGWMSIPVEHFRLAAQLALPAHVFFMRLEWPMLRQVIPGLFLLIFLLCITSFAVALALGGGPKATTIELAIYQALRFEFDLSKAAMLSLVQLAICAVTSLALLIAPTAVGFSAGLDRHVEFWHSPRLSRILDCIVLAAIVLFVAPPLLALLMKGIPAIALIPAEIWPSAVYSIVVALIAAALAVGSALMISILVLRLGAFETKLVEAITFLSLASSPFVIGTGLYIMIRPIADPFMLALPITIVVNTAMSMPFAIRIILPALRRAEDNFGRLGDSLGLSGFERFRIAIWPRLQRSVGFSAGLAAALSMGDLGVIALFANPDVATLPLMMYRLMASYQMEAASAVALLLMCITLILFWMFDRGGRLEHKIR